MIKLIVGFRRDQEHSVSMEEAHKAYYLFLHPESRGIFSDGLAIKGSQIEEIVPDWHGAMGWNPTHTLNSDDWNEMRDKGIDGKIRNQIAIAKDVARLCEPRDLEKPMSELLATRFPQLTDRSGTQDPKYLT